MPTATVKSLDCTYLGLDSLILDVENRLPIIIATDSLFLTQHCESNKGIPGWLDADCYDVLFSFIATGSMCPSQQSTLNDCHDGQMFHWTELPKQQWRERDSKWDWQPKFRSCDVLLLRAPTSAVCWPKPQFTHTLSTLWFTDNVRVILSFLSIRCILNR